MNKRSSAADQIMSFADKEWREDGELLLEDVLPDGTADADIDAPPQHFIGIASVPNSKSTQTAVLVGEFRNGKIEPSHTHVIVGSFQATLAELTRQGLKVNVVPTRGPKVALAPGYTLSGLGLQRGQN